MSRITLSPGSRVELDLCEDERSLCFKPKKERARLSHLRPDDASEDGGQNGPNESADQRRVVDRLAQDSAGHEAKQDPEQRAAHRERCNDAIRFLVEPAGFGHEDIGIVLNVHPHRIHELNPRPSSERRR